jgi:hypothetical protein
MPRPHETGRDDQRLTERMCMLGGACTRLERDAYATNTRRSETRRGEFGRLEYAVPGRPVDKTLKI